MNSFSGVVQVFYALFRSKHWTSFGGCSHCMLIVKCSFFFSYFSEALVLQNIIWWLLPLYANCEIRMFRKPLNNRSRAVVRTSFEQKGVLKKFEIFTGKQLCQSPFFGNAPGWGLQLYWKETPTQVFPCEICEIYCTGHLWN